MATQTLVHEYQPELNPDKPGYDPHTQIKIIRVVRDDKPEYIVYGYRDIGRNTDDYRISASVAMDVDFDVTEKLRLMADLHLMGKDSRFPSWSNAKYTLMADILEYAIYHLLED